LFDFSISATPSYLRFYWEIFSAFAVIPIRLPTAIGKPFHLAECGSLMDFPGIDMFKEFLLFLIEFQFSFFFGKFS